MRRYYITLGAQTTANGKVTTANHWETINGVPVALEGDKCWCPACNAEGVIVPDGPRLRETFEGRESALSDDLCVCKCTSSPRLVAAQTFAYQLIDGDSHAARADKAAQTAAMLNTAAGSPAASSGIPLVLLDPKTQEAYPHRPYKLQLREGVIEGTTDGNGATWPLTAAERSAVVAWHVDAGPAAA